MEQREAAICQWFDMWLTKRDTGIRDLFAPDAVYIESWGPEYHGADKIAWWFTEWNRRGTVERWDIRQFFHKGDQTVVEWTFANRMDDGRREVFVTTPTPTARSPGSGSSRRPGSENPKSGARSESNGRRCLDTKKGRLIFAAS